MPRCKRCGAPIVWRQTTGLRGFVKPGTFKREKAIVRRWVPLNLDLTPHFKTCVPSEETFVKELKRLEEENHV